MPEPYRFFMVEWLQLKSMPNAHRSLTVPIENLLLAGGQILVMGWPKVPKINSNWAYFASLCWFMFPIANQKAACFTGGFFNLIKFIFTTSARRNATCSTAPLNGYKYPTARDHFLSLEILCCFRLALMPNNSPPEWR